MLQDSPAPPSVCDSTIILLVARVVTFPFLRSHGPWRCSSLGFIRIPPPAQLSLPRPESYNSKWSQNLDSDCGSVWRNFLEVPR